MLCSQIQKDGRTLIEKISFSVLADDRLLDENDTAVCVERKDLPDGTVFQIKFSNRTAKTVHLKCFQARIAGTKNDFLSSAPGEKYRVYCEGWTMASPCGSHRYNDYDFDRSEGYLKYCVSAPEDCSSTRKNRFSADTVTVIENGVRNECLLAGFITSHHAFGHFQIELAANGVAELAAICDMDGIEVAPGETVQSEKLFFAAGPDGYDLLTGFAAHWGREMNARKWPHTPRGWCSWYYYFNNVTEKDMLENIAFIRSHREEYPIEYIQLDDGYQHACGDWLKCNGKFPDGIEFLVKKCNENGFKFGQWLAPFFVGEDSDVYQAHPEYVVHDKAGNVVWGMDFRNIRMAVLDGTNPGAQSYLRHVFSTLRKWGVQYVKLDFMVQACSIDNGVYYDRKATRCDALRQGLRVIREAFGDDLFILGCTAPFASVIGHVNGERIGTDITPYWQKENVHNYAEAPTVPNVCRNVINHCYLHKNTWLNDPDTHIARIDNNKLTANEVELWTNALYLTGGMMLLSDRFETLAPERAKYSKLILAETDRFEARPLDLFAEEIPSVWLARRRSDGEICIGFFNFTEAERPVTADLNRIKNGAEFELTGHFDGRQYGVFQNTFTATVAGHSSKLFTLKERK